jgi:hypothetical protein
VEAPLALALAGVAMRLDARQQRVEQIVLKPRDLVRDEGDCMEMTVGVGVGVGVGTLVQLGHACTDDAAGEAADAHPSQTDRR